MKLEADTFRTLLLLSYIFVLLSGYFLQYLNMRHLRRRGGVIPPEFEGHIDGDLLNKTRDYTLARNRLSLVASVFGDLLVISFFFGGFLNIYNSWILSFELPFVVSGALFFLILICARTVVSVPFDLYGTFRIENRYGFNTMTGRLWIADFLKSFALTAVLSSVLSLAAFFIIEMSPDFWWLILWAFFFFFSIFIMYVSPYVIEPLFNKFTPLEDETMEGSIRDLLKKAGIRVSRVFKVDASKRSRHTNAYFTGIGRVKRIVLFDTLIGNMTNDEVLSVLAHEAGHWKKKHILKNIVMVEAFSLAGLYIAFRLIGAGVPGALFDLEADTIFADLLILALIGGIASFPLTPLMSYLSRRHEREADRFAVEMTGNPAAMASSLVKISRDNLSNLHPHPLYAFFYYSHPPMVQRIRELKGTSSGENRG